MSDDVELDRVYHSAHASGSPAIDYQAANVNRKTTLASCCCSSNYLSVNGPAPERGSASDGCVQKDGIRAPRAQPYLNDSRQEHDHTTGTNL